MPAENRGGTINRYIDSAILDNSSVVLNSYEPLNRQSIGSATVGQPTFITSHGCTTPSQKETEADSMQTIWTSLVQRGVSNEAADIIMQSWSNSSIKQYNSYLKTWLKLCSEWNIDPYDPPLTRVLDFLTSLHDRGLKYDAINTAKSAVSAIAIPKNQMTLGNQPLISRFMKGVYKSRPPTPRYESTWDVQPVLQHLSSLASPEKLDLKMLTHKLVMLVALISAQRIQSIHLLDLQFMKASPNQAEFSFPEHIKQSRPGYTVPSVILKAYPTDPALCVIAHLKEYIERTRPLRDVETKLFISYVKPHKRVSKDTIGRWIRTVMVISGIDVYKFKPHSTRSAATSKAKQVGVPIQDILRQAGWSNHRTFDKFYNKPVRQESTFAQSVLQLVE